MSAKHDLLISANELEQLASSFPNMRICMKLEMAVHVMRAAAAEMDEVNTVPVWLVPVQDSVYMLSLSIIYAGWIVRTTVTPGAKQFNVANFAIDSYERLLTLLKTNTYATTRASRQYPHTTRRQDIRKALKKHDEQRRNT